MSSKQVILIGLDGLGWNEIERWTKNGTLSTIRSVIDDGTKTDLVSTTPPWTPCAWPSLLSGRNPGRHGIFDFFSVDGYDKSLIDRRNAEATYVNEVADTQELTSVLINYPVTHPVTNLETGAVVPGYLAPEDALFYPSEIRERYESKYGEYHIYPDYDTDENVIENYVTVARSRRDMARLLDEMYDWNLFGVQFQVTDSIFHDLNDMAKIRQILEKVDDYIGEIIELGDDAHVFIVSDHGMGDYSWTFYVNSWLAENGYCDTTGGENQYFRQVKTELKGEESSVESDRLAWLLKRIVNSLSAVGLSPKELHHLLSIVRLDTVVERFLPTSVLMTAQDRTVDYGNSTAFQILFNSLGIHLNVEGRQPVGQISEKQYDAIRNQLIDELSTVRDPDGNRVFEEVKPREAVFEGENIDEAPDIVLIPRDYQYDVSGSILDTFRRNPHKNHKPNGILVTNQDLEIEESASIYDIAPTVAAALELPTDSKTDGRILPPYSAATDEVDWGELRASFRFGDESGVTDTVEEKLDDLGYLE